MSGAVEVLEFLRSSDGRAMVTRALQRRGLPMGLAEDVVGEVARRAVSFEVRSTIDNPGGFATNAAQYVAADLLRGELRRPAPMTMVAEDDVDPASDERIEDDVLAQAALRDLRDALVDAVSTAPTSAASALAYLSARIEDAPPGPSCPAPSGGAGPQEAAEWAGLFYGGHDSCFPDAAVADGPALRKRRSRAVARMHETLRSAAAAALGEDGDD